VRSGYSVRMHTSYCTVHNICGLKFWPSCPTSEFGRHNSGECNDYSIMLIFLEGKFWDI